MIFMKGKTTEIALQKTMAKFMKSAFSEWIKVNDMVPVSQSVYWFWMLSDKSLNLQQLYTGS